MNYKRYIGATLAVFLFMFFYEWLVNSYFMMGMYEKTASVWRKFSEMQANMGLRILSLAVIAAWIALFYTQFYKTGSRNEGLMFGLFIGVLLGVTTASWYIWLPVPAELSLSWLTSNIVEGLGVGFILSAVYHK